ncbi:MAG TPA: methyltransferase domain-containing protein [Candidatus Elarobacter sp.]
MQFTGERYVPEPKGRTHYENLHRYSVAARLAAGKRVLDLASGEGYGAALLCRTAADVVGIDSDEACISHARSAHYHPNLRFVQGEATNVPLKDESIDLITSFETMQRLWDQEVMLDEFRRVLAPGGMVLLSTPNKLVYSDRSGIRNPYHVRELYYADLRDMLARRFPFVRIYGQRIVASSVLHPLAGSEEGTGTARWYAGDAGGVREELPELPHPVHFIAVCGDDAPEVEIASAFLDPHDDLLDDVHQELQSLRARVFGAAPLETANAPVFAQPVARRALVPAAPSDTEPDAVLGRDPLLQLADMRAWCENQVGTMTRAHAEALDAQQADHQSALAALTGELARYESELAQRTAEVEELRARCELFDAFKDQARRDLENVREQMLRERSAADRAASDVRQRVLQMDDELSVARRDAAAERERAERAEDELALFEHELTDERERRRVSEARLRVSEAHLRAALDRAEERSEAPRPGPAEAEAPPGDEDDAASAQIAAELELLRAELAEQQRAAADRELEDARQIQQLQGQSELLHSVLSSRSWRLTEPLRRAGLRFRKGH